MAVAHQKKNLGFAISHEHLCQVPQLLIYFLRFQAIQEQIYFQTYRDSEDTLVKRSQKISLPGSKEENLSLYAL